MEEGPPPPPPPHGANPRPSGGLPDGNYDIFIIPPHSAGGGFLYLPSLQPQRNSFLAGIAVTLAAVGIYVVVMPVLQGWFATVMAGNAFGVLILVAFVGLGAWALGKTTAEMGSGPSTGGSGASGTKQQQYQSAGPQPNGWAPPPRSENPPPPPPPQPEPAPPPSQEPEPKSQAKPPPAQSGWEKAREETRRREEERKRAEELKKKREAAQKMREEAEKARQEAAAAAQKAKEEAEAAAKKAQEDAERAAKAQAEKEKWEQARAREKEQREREARERLAKEKLAKEKEQREKDNREREAREKAEKDKQAARDRIEKLRAEREERQRAASASASQTSPSKPYAQPTAKSHIGTEETYSFRPYDTQSAPGKPRAAYKQSSASSISGLSESSYAPSMSTARTTPPPSQRGPYSTTDPDKIQIRAVYLFSDSFPNKPTAQLISGEGSVTDGLVLHIKTEGLFIDDDVRRVPQREWDVKAWTLKLVEDGAFKAGAGGKGLHVFRATTRDAENKKYTFVLEESETYKVAIGLQRLKKGSQVRSLKTDSLKEGAVKSLLDGLGWS